MSTKSTILQQTLTKKKHATGQNEPKRKNQKNNRKKTKEKAKDQKET
jgi:hypothetical protein